MLDTSETQALSHSVSQQNGSSTGLQIWLTHELHDESSMTPATHLSWVHGPHAPQSVAQSTQLSPKSQVPSPQALQAPQSMLHVTHVSPLAVLHCESPHIGAQSQSLGQIVHVSIAS